MESPLPNEVPGAHAVPSRSRPQSSACVRLHPGAYQPSDTARNRVWDRVWVQKNVCVRVRDRERKRDFKKRLQGVQKRLVSAIKRCNLWNGPAYPQKSAAYAQTKWWCARPIKQHKSSTKVKWANQWANQRANHDIFFLWDPFVFVKLLQVFTKIHIETPTEYTTSTYKTSMSRINIIKYE